MQTVLIVIHLLVALALISVVLLQRSEGGALGIGGGGGGGNAGFGSLFSPRGAASTLTRTTALLAFLFLVTSMSLTYLSLGASTQNSLFDVTPGAAPTLPSGAPGALPGGGPPTLPGAEGAAPAQPAEPAAPAGPPTLPGAAPEAPAE